MGRPSLAKITGQATVRRDVRWTQPVVERTRRIACDTGLQEQEVLFAALRALEAKDAELYHTDMLREIQALKDALRRTTRDRDLAKEQAQRSARIAKTARLALRGDKRAERFVKDLTHTYRPVRRRPLYPPSDSPILPGDRPPPVDRGPPGEGKVRT